MTSPERWEELQTRWAQGELLDEAEERERLAYATHDFRAKRELDLFAQLKARAAGEGEPLSQAFIDAVLEASAARPRLRLVAAGEAGAPPAPYLGRSARSALWPLAAGSLALAAALGAWMAVRSTPQQPAASARAARNDVRESVPARLASAHAELVLSAGEVALDGREVRLERRPLAPGQVVATHAGRACIRIDAAIDACLAENSRLSIESLVPSSVRLRVEAGLAFASRSRRSPGSSFSLLAADVSALAHGTSFAVRHEGGEVEVSVVEGNVEVTRGALGSVRVGPGSGVRVRAAGGLFEGTMLGQEAQARLVDLRASHALWSGSELGTLELAAASPDATHASIDGGAALPLPLQVLVATGRHRLSWRDAVGHQLAAWVEISTGTTQRLVPPSLRPPAAAAPSSKATAAPSAADFLDAARRELARGNPRKALVAYDQLRLTHPASPEARTVLTTIGMLELELGRPERALRSFDAYLRSGGTLGPEALSGKIRALRALGRQSEERAAILQYLARYRGGLQAPLLEKRLTELGGR